MNARLVNTAVMLKQTVKILQARSHAPVNLASLEMDMNVSVSDHHLT